MSKDIGKDIGKMIAAHIEYSDAVRKFADTADWKLVREHIAALEKEIEMIRDGEGPDFGDGYDAEGFPGGDKRMGKSKYSGWMYLGSEMNNCYLEINDWFMFNRDPSLPLKLVKTENKMKFYILEYDRGS